MNLLARRALVPVEPERARIDREHDLGRLDRWCAHALTCRRIAARLDIE